MRASAQGWSQARDLHCQHTSVWASYRASPAVDCKDTRKTGSEDWFLRPLYIMVRNCFMEMLRAFKTHPKVVPWKFKYHSCVGLMLASVMWSENRGSEKLGTPPFILKISSKNENKIM
jgi:hypothetical protein